MKKYLVIAVLSTFVACSNSGKEEASAADSASKPDFARASVEVELTDPKTENIYKGYIILKNSLVASNAKAVQTSAAALSNDLKAFEGCENTALIADKIAASGDLKFQRKEFTALSSDVIALFKHADLKQGTIFIQHCPMANNGDGGDWLSSEQKIRNPYYGDQMLGCGAVLEELKPAKLK